MIPHDVNGLMQLMGGRSGFIKNLDYIFENNQFDMANEPDIAYLIYIITSREKSGKHKIG